MSYLLAAALGLAMVVACGPTVYVMELQVRTPSSSGYSLGGKEMGVVYVCSPQTDSVYAKSFAESFASVLEQDYFNNEEKVGVYTLPYVAGSDYASRDTLVNLVMDTEKDVIFLFDGLSKDGTGKLYVYDSEGKEDAVKTFPGTVLEPFLSNWEDMLFYFYNYDSITKWNKAYNYVDDFKWRQAIDIWLEIAEKEESVAQKAHAAFNLANTFFILGDLRLAAKWLDMSDKLGKCDYSDYLRSRIERGR